MNKTLPLLAGLLTCGLMTLTTARGQAIYATPYTFVTIAGTAGVVGNGADGTNGLAQFYFPEAVAVDTNDNLYVVDNFFNDVRKVTPVGTNWVVTTIAGAYDPIGGFADGTNQAAQFNEPTSITMDRSNNLYVTDGNNNTLRKITPMGTNWVVTTIAGTASPNTDGGSADGTNGVAQFNYPAGITVDAAGNLYVADTYNDTIRRVVHVGTNWVVTTIAGTAQGQGSNDGTNQAAQFNLPDGIAVDGSHNLYVADDHNNTIRKITPVGTNWVVSTIAGSIVLGAGFTDGTNTDAQFSSPGTIALDASGNLYVADTGNNAIRKVAPIGTNWVVTTLAGAPDGSTGTNDGTGLDVSFNSPYGIAVDAAGNLYVADSGNSTIREGYLAPAAPNLAISLSAGSLVISWPGSGFTLQTNADLTTANWGNYGGLITSGSGTNSVTLPPSGGALFFRLTN
jgi:sugar lactone lactonase YvrE